MKKITYLQAPIYPEEEDRLKSLYAMRLLDTPPEERFDRITKLAQQIFKVPISTITLVDSQREWFKSCQGLPAKEGGRAISFCGHAIYADDIFIIPDTKNDERFRNNPMVVGNPYIRFYAGVPLKTTDGKRIGVFCIKDTKPRKLNKEKISLLKSLANWAEIELNMHELQMALTARRKAELRIADLNEVLRLINKILRHDILNNLTVIKANTQLMQRGIDPQRSLDLINKTIDQSTGLISQMRELESAISSGNSLKIYKMDRLIKLIATHFPALKISIKGEGEVVADEAIISAIENIIRNAQMHGKSQKVNVDIKNNSSHVEIRIADDGIGIPRKIKNKLFIEGFKYGESAHAGLGLYIVKKTIERYGGKIFVEDNKPNGTEFIIKLLKPNGKNQN